ERTRSPLRSRLFLTARRDCGLGLLRLERPRALLTPPLRRPGSALAKDVLGSLGHVGRHLGLGCQGDRFGDPPAELLRGRATGAELVLERGGNRIREGWWSLRDDLAERRRSLVQDPDPHHHVLALRVERAARHELPGDDSGGPDVASA